MSSPIVTMFRDLVAAANAEPDDVKLERFLSYAVRRTDQTTWGDFYDEACCYLAGHLLVKSAYALAGGASPGGVSSESAGGMSRSYGAPAASMSDSELATTAPGMALVQLGRGCTFGAMVVGGDASDVEV